MAEDYVSYARLRSWIATQETYEQEHGRPAPLTEAERQAIAVLMPPLVQTPTPAVEQATTDWISLLARYDNVHASRPGRPTYEDEFLGIGAGNVMLWRTHCTLPREAPGLVFPQLQPGDRTTGVFPRKKDAKQYAAQCATQWLMANRFMPTDGVAVTFPKSGKSAAAKPSAARPKTRPPFKPAAPGPAPRPAAPVTASTSSATGRPASQRPATPPASALPPSPATSDLISFDEISPSPSPSRIRSMVSGIARKRPLEPGSADVSGSSARSGDKKPSSYDAYNSSDDERSNDMEDLVALCRVLGLGMPRVDLHNHGGIMDGFYSGRVVFSPAAASLAQPEDFCVADTVYTKRAARRQIVAKALAHVRALPATRG